MTRARAGDVEVPRVPDQVIRHLELHWPAVRGVVVLFIVVHAILAFANLELAAHLPFTAAAFVTISVAAVMIASAAAEPFPWSRSASVLALCAATAILQSFVANPLKSSSFAHWDAAAITFILLILAVRGRPGTAWLGYAALLTFTVVWAVLHGLSVGEGVSIVIRHAATLMAGTLFAVGLRRTARSLLVMNDERTAAASAQARAIAGIEERKAQLLRVNSMARPMLERLTHEQELDDQERDVCLRVEASLRDAMRGRSLFIEPAIYAAHAARVRGVEVTFLDDSGNDSPARAGLLAQIVARELESVEAGRFTARLLPDGRGDVGTIVVDTGHEHRMLIVGSDLTVRDA